MPNVSFNKKPSEYVSHKRSWGSTLEIVVFIVLAVLVYIYLVAPKKQEYTERKEQLSGLTEDEKRVSRQKKSFERLASELRDNQTNLAKLDEVIPLEGRTSSVYVLTEYLAQSAGMTSSSIAVESDPETIAAGNKGVLQNPFGVTRKLSTIPVTVNAIGSMDQLLNFLSQVENSHRLVDITSVDISQGKDSQFIFKVGLSAYAFSPEKPDAEAGLTPSPVVTSPQ